MSLAVDLAYTKQVNSPPNQMLSTIPFSGFYETIHDNVIDRAIESLFENDRGDCNTDFINHFYSSDCIDFEEVRGEYAKDYTQAFAIKSKLQLTFDELNSPKSYNFTSDRIFVNITEESVRKLFTAVDKDVLRQLIKEEFTSRPGFISYYSSDLDEWPEDITEWDHNQIGTLISVAVNFDEEKYMEDLSGSGEVVNWVNSALKEEGNRLVNIASYLRTREERAYNTSFRA
jgi:hypothetical protein